MLGNYNPDQIIPLEGYRLEVHSWRGQPVAVWRGVHIVKFCLSVEDALAWVKKRPV